MPKSKHFRDESKSYFDIKENENDSSFSGLFYFESERNQHYASFKKKKIDLICLRNEIFYLNHDKWLVPFQINQIKKMQWEGITFAFPVNTNGKSNSFYKFTVKILCK